MLHNEHCTCTDFSMCDECQCELYWQMMEEAVAARQAEQAQADAPEVNDVPF